jgi:hypothetical protein
MLHHIEEDPRRWLLCSRQSGMCWKCACWEFRQNFSLVTLGYVPLGLLILAGRGCESTRMIGDIDLAAGCHVYVFLPRIAGINC